MGDHIPLADKVRAEVDAFATLWRRRRWLAVVLLVGLVALVLWSIASNWIKAKEIDRLQGEKSRLEATLRETERENRGLRETVAPLIARAAREFPGEEINASLKKLLEQMEAERPGNRPLASASAAVEVITDSPAQVSAHFMDHGGFLGFAKGSNALMLS